MKQRLIDASQIENKFIHWLNEISKDITNDIYQGSESDGIAACLEEIRGTPTIAALRGPTREQVEKVWRSEWAYPACEWNLPKCPKCGCNSKDATYGHKNNFCPRCGRPMTDEAVQMVMERLAALYE